MEIIYYGHSCFLFKGQDYSICLDPYGDIGLKIPKIKADYVFCSHSHYDHNNYAIVEGAKEVKENEYFKIIKSYHDDSKGALRGENNILLFTLDGYKIAFMGDYGESDNASIITELKGAHILLIPIGGKYTIDSKTAKYYVDKISPKTIVPMHYKIKNSTVDISDEKYFLSLFSGYKKVDVPYNYNNDLGVLVLTPKTEG